MVRLGSFREMNGWDVEWVANRQEMDVEPDSRTVIDLSLLPRYLESWYGCS